MRSFTRILSPTLMHLLAPEGEGTGGGAGGGEGGDGGEGGQQKPKEGEGEGSKKVDPLEVDITKAIEKARQQEKSKLYNQITEAERARKTAEDLAKAKADEAAALRAEIEKMKKQPETKPKEGEGDPPKKPVVDEETINRIVDATLKTANKQFEEQLSAAQKKIEELEGGVKTRTVAEYRQKLISENADYIIPELVQGDSPEALDNSLITAKQAFARIAKALNKGGTQEGDKGGNPAGSPQRTIVIPTPNINSDGAPGAPKAVDVKRLSDADYAKNRQALLAAAAEEARKAVAGE